MVAYTEVELFGSQEPELEKVTDELRVIQELLAVRWMKRRPIDQMGLADVPSSRKSPPPTSLLIAS
jgi:hypothetical protein